MGKCQWIFTKLGICIDIIIEVWFGIANGQSLSIFDRVICPLHDNVWILSFHIFYFLLPRSSKGYMAQLMRIYIVTPEGPLKVSVNPLIQPAPHPCPIFHPGTGGEIDLTSGSVWVMRLPYPFYKLQIQEEALKVKLN